MHKSTSTVALVIQIPQAVIVAPPDTFMEAYRTLGGVPRLISSTTNPMKVGTLNLSVLMGPPRLLSHILLEQKDHSDTFYGLPELATTIKSSSGDIMLPKLAAVKHVVNESGKMSITVNGHKSMVLLLPNQRSSIVNYYAYQCGVSENTMASYTPYLECGVMWFLTSILIVAVFTTTMWLVTRRAMFAHRKKSEKPDSTTETGTVP